MLGLRWGAELREASGHSDTRRVRPSSATGLGAFSFSRVPWVPLSLWFHARPLATEAQKDPGLCGSFSSWSQVWSNVFRKERKIIWGLQRRRPRERCAAQPAPAAAGPRRFRWWPFFSRDPIQDPIGRRAVCVSHGCFGFCFCFKRNTGKQGVSGRPWVLSGRLGLPSPGPPHPAPPPPPPGPC